MKMRLCQLAPTTTWHKNAEQTLPLQQLEKHYTHMCTIPLQQLQKHYTHICTIPLQLTTIKETLQTYVLFH